jgi:hypothetical protein
LNEYAGGSTIVSLAFGDLEDERQSPRVDHQVNLGRQPSA